MPQVRPNVLLVDDVPANLLSLEALLGGLDCELVQARSGNEALRELIKRDIAVVLLDVQMPEMDGYEVARYARSNPATSQVPIIFLTAMHRTDEGALRGYGTGAVDFLFKPVDARILRAKVSVFLELYRSQQRLRAEMQAHQQTATSLAHANKALTRFTQAASHDLRAPVRTICGFLDALDEETAGSISEQAAHYLDRSRKAGRRLEALLNSLLAYSRLQRPNEPTPIDTQSVVEAVKVDLSERLGKEGATLDARELPKVTADRDRLYQLFANLVGNALKFRRQGEPPQIRISAVLDGGTRWVFCVEDNGIGIPPEHHSAVFGAFRRLHSDSEYEGSGLGLAICQEIVEQHGGTIWLESSPGVGSRFYFGLPFHAEAPAPVS